MVAPGQRPDLPEKFIPLAESGGLISEIGAMALRETCRALHHWDSHAHRLAIRVGEPFRPPAPRPLAAAADPPDHGPVWTAPKRLILESRRPRGQ